MSRGTSFFLFVSNWVTCPFDAFLISFLPALMAAMGTCTFVSTLWSLLIAVGVFLASFGTYMALRQYGYVLDEDAPHLYKGQKEL